MIKLPFEIREDSRSRTVELLWWPGARSPVLVRDDLTWLEAEEIIERSNEAVNEALSAPKPAKVA